MSKFHVSQGYIERSCLFFFKKILLFLFYICNFCLYVFYAPCLCNARSVQRRALDSLELELQAVVNHLFGGGS